MAKESKDKKQAVAPKETVTLSPDTNYHTSIGISKTDRQYKVVISSVGDDGSSKIKEEFKASTLSEAMEMCKIWCVTKVLDPLTKAQ